MVDTCYLKHLESLVMIVVMLIKDQFFSFFFPLDHALNLDLRSGTALTKSHLSLSVEIQKSYCSTTSGQVLYVPMSVLIIAECSQH